MVDLRSSLRRWGVSAFGMFRLKNNENSEAPIFIQKPLVFMNVTDFVLCGESSFSNQNTLNSDKYPILASRLANGLVRLAGHLSRL